MVLSFLACYNTGNETQALPDAGHQRLSGGTPAGAPHKPMAFYKDMELICRNCGEKFIFTSGEQEFYADKGFLHEPTRCPRCRSRRESGDTRSARPPDGRSDRRDER